MISIIGAGAFGTALAIYAYKLGHKVKVWSFEKELPDKIIKENENTIYLPGISIPQEIYFSNDIKQVLEDTQLAIFSCPSAYLRNISLLAVDYLPANINIISAAKGIENETLLLMNQILEQTLHYHIENISYISGPSFAREIANGLPTDITCASKNINTARKVQKILHSPSLRIYTTDDVIGVELGGALKNIIAVACGVSDGLQLGASARASLMTRGLAEITRLGTALGANPITFLGLSGVGDLFLTCTGNLSRNRNLGLRLAKGEKASDIIKSEKSVAEGYVTAKSAYFLTKKMHIEMPISNAVYRVCYENSNLKNEIYSLMNRAKKDE